MRCLDLNLSLCTTAQGVRWRARGIDKTANTFISSQKKSKHIIYSFLFVCFSFLKSRKPHNIAWEMLVATLVYSLASKGWKKTVFSVMVITNTGWNKVLPALLSPLETSPRRNAFFFFCFLFVLSKAGLPYNSTSYLPWHLLTVKLSSLLLWNTAILLPTSTTQYNSSPSLFQLGFLEKNGSILHFIGFSSVVAPMPKGCCYFLPSASPMPLLPPRSPLLPLWLLKACFPQSGEAEGGPCGVTPSPAMFTRGSPHLLLASLSAAQPASSTGGFSTGAGTGFCSQWQVSASPPGVRGVQIRDKDRISLTVAARRTAKTRSRNN